MSKIYNTQVRGCHKELAAFEEQSDALQEKRKLVDERMRDFDRRTARGMKMTMKFPRMGAQKDLGSFEFSDLGRSSTT